MSNTHHHNHTSTAAMDLQLELVITIKEIIRNSQMSEAAFCAAEVAINSYFPCQPGDAGFVFCNPYKTIDTVK